MYHWPRHLFILPWLLLPIAAVDAQEVTATEVEKLLQNAQLATDNASLLKLFRQHILTAPEKTQLRTLLEQLDSPVFKQREKATADIIALGAKALPQLRATVAAQADNESVQRAKRCIESIERKAQPENLMLAAELLRLRRQREVLLPLWQSVPHLGEHSVQDVVLAALLDLQAPGMLAPEIVAGLKAEDATVRAAAALLVGHAGSAEQKAFVAPLLGDKQPLVRLRAAQAALLNKDAAGFKPLLALIAEAPFDIAQRADDLLRQAAGTEEPTDVLLLAADRRRAYCDSWQRWLDKQAAQPSWQPLTQTAASLSVRAWAHHTTQQFLQATMHTDLAALTRVTQLPFLVSTAPPLKNREELDAVFRELAKELDPSKVVFYLNHLKPVEQYLRQARGETRAVFQREKVALPHVYVLIGHSVGGPDANEPGAIVLTIQPGRCKVLGLLEPR